MPPDAPDASVVPEGPDTATAVAGVRVGHWTHRKARTGCTVVLLPPGGSVTSGMALGSAPGSREHALLSPEKVMDRAHAVVLTGGSAFGLDAATGVMRWLEERGEGFPTPGGPVGIVPAAVLYDLGVGRADVRPDAAAGYAAARDASDRPVEMGSVGAGTGATVNALRGPEAAVRSGLGSALVRVGGAVVGAVAVSNAAGALVDPDHGTKVAGRPVTLAEAEAAFARPFAGTATTLVCVVTDARVDKSGCRALATAAHVGVARVTRPSHTVFDGDTCFVSATGTAGPVPLGALGVAVQDVVAAALLRGARAAAGS